jgi:hypothetical protein
MPRPLLNRAAPRGWALVFLLLLGVLNFSASTASAPSGVTAEKPSVLLVLSAPGEDQFTNSFYEVAESWRANCEFAKIPLQTFGVSDKNTNDLEEIKKWLGEQPRTGAELWIVLHGHGTYDNREGKFNLRGPDLSVTEFAKLLQPFERPLVIVLGFSSSAAFMPKLTGKERIVISATRSGVENNFTRFGEYFAEMVVAKDGDLDKDGQTSALEAFLMTSRKVAEFYSNAGRLMTEHALLDDNGDGVGTGAEFFKGVRAVKKATGAKAIDGSRAKQITLLPVEAERDMPLAWKQQRDALELEVEQLRSRKEKMDRLLYYKELEQVMLKLAALYGELPETPAPKEATAP